MWVISITDLLFHFYHHFLGSKQYYGKSKGISFKIAFLFLGDRANSVDTDSFYTASYDSPMKFWNRRNEIMFPLKEQ